MFGLAGFQGRLLGECQHLDGGGFAAVLGLKRLGRAARRGVRWRLRREDHRSSSSCGNPSISRTGRLFGSWFGGGEAHVQGGDEVGFQSGVVQLGSGDRGPVEGGAVECEPAGDTVGAEGLHLVADRDVGVQVRVAGAGVAVVECRGDQPGGVDLFDAVGAHAGKRRVLFEEGRARRRRLCGGRLRRFRRCRGALSPIGPTPI